MEKHHTISYFVDMTMSTQEFRAALKELGISQRQLSAELESHHTAVNNWARGKAKVPGPVSAYLRLRLRVMALVDPVNSAK